MKEDSAPRGPHTRLFGTDGIRGLAGEFPLDEQTVEMIGRSLAVNLSRDLGRPPALILGRDTRESGPTIESALASGALAEGAHVESAGVITTPAVAYLARSTPFDAGIVISASHNPYQDNGIKVFSSSGKKLADRMERRIEEDLARRDGRGSRKREPAAGKSIGNAEAIYRRRYIDYLVNEVGGGLSLNGLKLGIDCANGAASAIAGTTFERLGAKVTAISAQPNGRNINEGCGSLHPQALMRTVVEEGLELGIAFDGDADRALYVDAQGALVDGDHALLILGQYMKSRGGLRGNLVVSTVMSNVGLEIALKELGIEMVRASVGDRYVLEELLARNGSLGGEQSGHIIFPDISLAGDGIITGIEMLRAISASGRTLSELAARLTRFPQVLVNVTVRSKPPLDQLAEVSAEIDRMKTEMQGRGRLLVRYSGTENVARVMVEGEDQDRIEKYASNLAETIKKAIG